MTTATHKPAETVDDNSRNAQDKTAKLLTRVNSGLCVLCRGKPRETETGYGCFGCLNRQLGTLSELEDYTAALTPEKVTGDGGRGAPGFHGISPARDDVLVALDYRSGGGSSVHRPRDPRDSSDNPVRSILGSLHGIAEHIRDERAMTPNPAPTVASEVACIKLNLNWYAEQATADADGNQHPWITDLAGDLAELHSTARRLSPFAEPQWFIGNCRSPRADGDECGARLYAAPDADYVDCPRCEDRWKRRQWLWLGRVLDDEAV